MIAPPNTLNTAVSNSWGQFFREWKCKRSGHQFYVPHNGYYPGMPQSHCYRCGVVGPRANNKCAKWVEPIGN